MAVVSQLTTKTNLYPYMSLDNTPIIILCFFSLAIVTNPFENPLVQANLARLEEIGYAMLAPEEGWLACRSVGKGRMADPAVIVDAVAARLTAAPPKRGRPPLPAD